MIERIEVIEGLFQPISNPDIETNAHCITELKTTCLVCGADLYLEEGNPRYCEEHIINSCPRLVRNRPKNT